MELDFDQKTLKHLKNASTAGPDKLDMWNFSTRNYCLGMLKKLFVDSSH